MSSVVAGLAMVTAVQAGGMAQAQAAESATVESSVSRVGVVQRDGWVYVDSVVDCSVPTGTGEYSVEVYSTLRQRRPVGLITDYAYQVDEFSCDGTPQTYTHAFLSESEQPFRFGRSRLTGYIQLCWSNDGPSECLRHDLGLNRVRLRRP